MSRSYDSGVEPSVAFVEPVGYQLASAEALSREKAGLHRCGHPDSAEAPVQRELTTTSRRRPPTSPATADPSSPRGPDFDGVGTLRDFHRAECPSNASRTRRRGL